MLLALGVVQALAFSGLHQPVIRRTSLPAPPLIVAAPPPSPPPPVKGAGFYIRPSAAVERGGGFYVPGAAASAPCARPGQHQPYISAARAQGSREIVFVSSWRRCSAAGSC